MPNIGDMMILITFADGDRRLFNASYFKDNPNFKPISTPSDVACAYVEGCTVAWKDKEEMFFELPPGFLYQHSVSLSALGSAVTQELDRAFDEERNRFYCKSLNETAKELEDRLKNNRLSDNFAKDKVAKKKKSRTDEEIQRELNEAIESIRPELENLKPLDEDAPISDDNAAKTETNLTEKEIQQAIFMLLPHLFIIYPCKYNYNCQKLHMHKFMQLLFKYTCLYFRGSGEVVKMPSKPH